MRILFVGNGEIAKASLNIFLDEILSHDICGIVGPDSFFEHFKCNHLFKFTLDLQDRNEEKLLMLIELCKPDIILSVQYPWIFSTDIIKVMNGKIINLHNAKLPDYRGHHSISYAILNKDEFYTSTLHWVAAEVDRGLMIKEVCVSINDNETAYSLWNKTFSSCSKLIKDFFSSIKYVNDIPVGVPIASGGRFYSKKLIEQRKCILEFEDFHNLDLHARAFHFPPYEPAYLKFDGRKIYLVPECDQ